MLTTAALACTAFLTSADFDHSHGELTAVLKSVVHGDQVDYQALKKDPTGLRAYIDQLEAVTREAHAGWTRDQRHAFWINAYNAYTLDVVVRHYPVASIKDIGSATESVWKKAFIPLGQVVGEPGTMLSLDRIEHEILRPTFKDARVHAAVNCASEGCPPLRPEAFRAKDLSRQLDEQVRAWLATPGRNRIAKGKKLHVSRIFDWFREDFERDAGSVTAWMARYTDGELSTWLASKPKVKIEYLDYGWGLNDHRP